MNLKNNVLNSKLFQIKQQIPNPTQGLPEEVFEFVTTLTPMVNVDLLIKDDTGRILLAWRDDEYCGRGWHIPGGIIRYKETTEERIQKTALKELGTEIKILKGPVEIHEIFMPQEVRGHFISLLFECRIPEEYILSKELLWDETIAKTGTLKWHDKKPELVRGQEEVYAHIFSTEGNE